MPNSLSCLCSFIPQTAPVWDSASSGSKSSTSSCLCSVRTHSASCNSSYKSHYHDQYCWISSVGASFTRGAWTQHSSSCNITAPTSCDVKSMLMNPFKKLNRIHWKDRVRELSALSPLQDIFTSLTSHLCNLMDLLSYCQSILRPICHSARWDLSPDLHLPNFLNAWDPNAFSYKQAVSPTAAFSPMQRASFSFCSSSSRFQPPVGVTEHFKAGGELHQAAIGSTFQGKKRGEKM